MNQQQISWRASILHAWVVFSLFGSNFSGTSPMHRTTEPSSKLSSIHQDQRIAEHASPPDPTLPMPIINRQTPRTGVRPSLDLNDQPRPIPTIPSTKQAQSETQFNSKPVMFIENVGQFDPRAAFVVRGGLGMVNISSDAVWITTLERPQEKSTQMQGLQPAFGDPQPTPSPETDAANEKNQPLRSGNLRIGFQDANPTSKIEGFDRLDTKVSYFIGDNPDQWRSDVPVWGGMRYVDLYPGVDLELGSVDDEWSWSLVVRDETRFMNEYSNKDGSKEIHLRIEGAQQLERVDSNLNVQTEVSNFLLPLPVIEKPGIDKSVESARALEESIQISGDEIIIPLSAAPASTGFLNLFTSFVSGNLSGFANFHGGKSGLMSVLTSAHRQVGGEGDLFFSTYLGGSEHDRGMGVAANRFGEAYVTVCTASSDYPTKAGIYPFGGNYDLAVTKFSADGKSLIYSTFIGGSGEDCVNNGDYTQVGRSGEISLGEDGSAYILTNTRSNNFPHTTNAYDQIYNGMGDPVVLKINPSGTSLVYSTYFGGNQPDYGHGLAYVPPSFVYITGMTASGYPENPFPTSAGAYDTSFNGVQDAFVSKLDLSQSGANSLIYSTLVGGTNLDQGHGIAVKDGIAYVTGQNLSGGFPTHNALYPNPGGGYDSVYFKLNTSGSNLIYSTYLGGSADDCESPGDYHECAIALDQNGSAYISGITNSDNFPTYQAYDSDHNGPINGNDVFITKFSPDGSSLEYSTYLGGSAGERSYAMTLDSTGAAYIIGSTTSSLFPITDNALDTIYDEQEAFVAKMSPDGSELVYSTFLGGSLIEYGGDIALDPAWTIYATGRTYSDDYIRSTNPYDDSYNGNVDAILTNFGTGAYNSAISNSSGNSDCGSKQGSADGRECPTTLKAQLLKGDPIHTENGGFDFSVGYFSIPTSAGQLVFQLSYSSQATEQYTTTTGFGWSHNHATYLIFPDDPGGEEGVVIFKAHSLNQYRFYEQDDGTFTPDYGVTYSLERISGTPITYRLSDKSQRVYTFDENGKLTNWMDAQGHGWSYVYDGNGRLDRISADSGSRYLDLGYDGQGRVNSVVDQAARQVDFGYDGAGDLTSITDILDHSWTLTYDGSHHLRLVTDPAGKVIAHTEYDGQGRAYQQFDNNNNKVLELEYQSGGVVNVTNGLGISDSHAYDERKTVTQETNALEGARAKTYDINFRPTSISDENGHTVQMTWSKGQQNLQAMIDAGDNRTDLGYDDLNNLVSVIDPRDFLTTYTYSGTLMLSSMDALSNSTQYTYTTAADAPQPVGLLKAVSDPLGHLTSFTYNAFGQRISTTDPNGTTTYAYDELGRLESVTRPSGRSDWTCYDASDRVIRTVSNTSGDGGTPQTDPCDANNYQPSTTSGYDRINSIVYDLSGNVIARTDPKGIITRTYYDANNRPTVVVHNLVGQSIETIEPPEYDPEYSNQNIRSESVYDLNGNVIASIDPFEKIARTYFDDLNRPVTVTINLAGQAIEVVKPPAYNPAYPDQNISTQTIYDAAGNAIATIDPLGKTTRTYYDATNRPVSVVQNLVGQTIENPDPPTFNTATPDQNVRTDTVYDENGNAIATTDPLGTIVRTYYDALNRPETTVQNLFGRTIYALAPDRNPEDPIHNLRTDYVYDEAGNMIATVDPAGHVTRTYFDDLNRPITVTVNLAGVDIYAPDPPTYNPEYPDRNISTGTVYDDYGKVIATIDPLGRITRTYYDDFDRPSIVVRNWVGSDIFDPNAPDYNPNYPDQNFHSETIYGPDGEVIATKSNDGKISRIYYDVLGRQQYVVQNLQGQTIYETNPPVFNPAYPDQNVRTETVYDASGAVVKNIDTLGHVTYACYDGANRTVKTILNPSVSDPCSAYAPDPDSDQDITTTFSYDAAGNRLSQTDPNGKQTSYTYDDLYRLTNETDPLSHSVHYDYDGIGNRVALTDARSTVTRYDYDVLGRLITVIENYRPGYQPNQETNVTTAYTYDVSGNRKTIVDARYKTTQFSYDLMNRLTLEINAINGSTVYGYNAVGNQVLLHDTNGHITQFIYDGLGRLTLIDYPDPDSSVTYTYDSAGNRIAMSDGIGQTQWSYDDLNRTISVTDPFSHTVGYGYDGTGNRATITYPDSKTVNYTFDAAGRLHLTTAWDSLTTTYTYDRSGRLQSVVLPNAVNTNYTYDDAGRLSNLVHSRNGQNLMSSTYTYDANGNRTGAIESGEIPPIYLIFADGFERGDLLAWSQSVTDGGDLRASSSAASIDNYGLLAEIDDNNSLYVTDQTPDHEKTYQARFYFDPNSIEMAEGDVFMIFQALNAAGNPAARVELGYTNGYYQLRESALATPGYSIYSNWIVITDETHPIEISWNADNGDPATHNSMTMYVDGEPKVSVTGIDNSGQRIESARMGVIEGVDDGTRGDVYFDGFESRRIGPIGPDPYAPIPQTFLDDFETGNFLAWSSKVSNGNTLVIYDGAAINGILGLRILINTNDSAYLRHNFGAADEYHARFYFDPNGITMAEGDQHTILQFENGQGLAVARVELRYQSGSYQVRGVSIQDDSQPVNGSWTMLSDDRHALELGWKGASSQGADDGWLTLHLDGEEKYTLTGIDSDTLRAELVKLGVVDGLDDGTRGLYFLDSFKSQYTGVVGLMPNGATPDLFMDSFETGNYLAWSSSFTSGGELNVNSQALINGELGLQTTISSTNSVYLRHNFTSTAGRFTRFYFDPNSIAMATGDQHTIMQHENGQGLAVARVELSYQYGYYLVRGVAIGDDQQPINGDWITLSDDRHALELDWYSATSPGANDGWERLYLDGIEKYTQSGIDNDTLLATSVKLGAVEGVDDGTRGGYYFDSFKSRSTATIGLEPNGATPDIFEDGFESGNTLAWLSGIPSQNELNVSSNAAINDVLGMEVTISTGDSIYLWHDFDNTTEYHARFYFDPNTITMANGDSHILMQFKNRYNGTITAQVELADLYGNYLVRGIAVQDDYEPVYGPWIILSDDAHAIELGWKSASMDGANDGWVKLHLDGEEKYTLSDLDNDTMLTSQVNLGVVDGIDGGTSGIYFFDSFESKSTGYIGLEPDGATPDLFEDGFETGDYQSWSSSYTTGGSLNVNSQAVINGELGLETTITASDSVYLKHNFDAADEYHARFYYDPNGIGMASDDQHTILRFEDGVGLAVARVELVFQNGFYQVRGIAIQDDAQTIAGPWVMISNDRHAIELGWKGANYPGANNGWLKLYTDGEEKYTLSNIDSDTLRAAAVKLGAVEGVDNGTRGSYYFDSFRSRYSSYIGLEPNGAVPELFEDGFENGNYLAWSSSSTAGGSLNVNSQAAINGTLGLQTTISTTNGAYLAHNFGATAEYYARFYFDPNSIAMVTGDQHSILQLENAQASVAARVELSYKYGYYLVRGVVIQDSGQAANGAWVTLPDDRHAIELGWKGASSDGANDGWLKLVLDGVEKSNQTGIDNDTWRAAAVKLGAVAGVDSGTHGNYFFDSFKSHATSAIGLEPNGALPGMFEDGFESGNLLTWSTYSGPAGSLAVTTTAAITGGMGLLVKNASLPEVDQDFAAKSEYHARFYFDPNSSTWQTGSAVKIFSLRTTGYAEKAFISVTFSVGDYQVRAGVYNDQNTLSQTPLVLVSDGPHALEIKWKASTTPGGSNGSLTFWIDGVQQGSLTGLDIDYQVIRAKLGSLNSVTGWSAPVYFDCFEANFDHYIGLDPSAPPAPPFPSKPDALFSDNFESGNFSAWSATTTGGGDLSVSTQAAISGTYGMKALINDNGAIYVTDWKPFEETRYRARFYFDPNTITMASNNAHYLLYASDRTEPNDVVVARVELRRYNNTYQVRAAVVNDSTTWSSTAWTTISDAPHKLEIDWKAATAPLANNGGITFWVDGVQKGTFTNIDNDTRRVDYIQFGAVAGIDTGTRGTEYFDAFVSRRVSYIGMQFPSSMLFGMAGLGTQSEQLLAGLEVAQKVLAAPAPIQQPVQISNMTPVADPPATSLAATQQSQLITTTVVISYTYDPLNRLTAADYDGGMYFHYTYDAVGNRVVEATNVLTSVYGYDDLNRLVYYNGVNYAWDDNGNLLNDGVNSYTYDRANRLIGVSGVGISVNYSYNGLGDRLSETANSQTTHYTMDLNAGLTQVLQDGTNTYLYGAGRVAQYGANGPEYYLGDALGSVRQMVDANGDVTLGRMYKPYGGVLSSTGNGATSYGFTNEYTSQGLIYLRARFYSPSQGRFLTKDTWEGDYQSPLTLNRWNYVQSNPINYQDPTGNFRIICPSGWSNKDVYERVNEAEKYVDPTFDSMDTYTAAGIAIQCAGWDNPTNPNSGLGIAQVSRNQANTEWGEPVYGYTNLGRQIIEDKSVERGYGLRCPDGELEEALDPNNNKDAVILMKRRIQLVMNECNSDNCADTDKYIVAALAQNGPGFSHIRMQRLGMITHRILKSYNLPPDTDVRRDWFTFFLGDAQDHNMVNTKTQLNRFVLVINELRSRSWFIPPISSNVIDVLKNWPE